MPSSLPERVASLETRAEAADKAITALFKRIDDNTSLTVTTLLGVVGTLAILLYNLFAKVH